VSICIALLRGINVAGHKSVTMGDLRDVLTQLGFADAQSLLQSGNLVFRSAGPQTAARLEKMLEAEASHRLNLQTDFFVRTSQEWGEIVAGNPFRDEARLDPGHLVVMFLKEAPAPNDVTLLRAAIRGPEIVRASGRQLYITYPDGIGRSKLTNVLIEKQLGTRGTSRNWNTVLKVEAAVSRR